MMTLSRERIFLASYISAMFYISLSIDGPDVADNVNTSRDCLLSTSTNTADGWTFDGLLWRATSSLWRRVTKGHTTSNKSKQK